MQRFAQFAAAAAALVALALYVSAAPRPAYAAVALTPAVAEGPVTALLQAYVDSGTTVLGGLTLNVADGRVDPTGDAWADGSTVTVTTDGVTANAVATCQQPGQQGAPTIVDIYVQSTGGK